MNKPCVLWVYSLSGWTVESLEVYQPAQASFDDKRQIRLGVSRALHRGIFSDRVKYLKLR